MLEKQRDLAERYDYLRALVCREPRGHRNLLGAFITEPVTEDGDAGIIFIHPDGYFDACGDSTFSASVALLESGIVPRKTDNGEQIIRLDTVAGRVNVRATLRNGQVVSVAMRSLPAVSLGGKTINVPGIGEVTVDLAWSGLLYAIVTAEEVGASLGAPGSGRIGAGSRERMEHLLDMGTRIWQVARSELTCRIPGGPADRSVDLVTLVHDIGDNGAGGPEGARVANFYGPRTMGRTPSGTGTAARVAVLHTRGCLPMGVPYYHESPLGLRFTARVVEAGESGVVSEIETMSYLMGISTLIVRDDDPFPEGFSM